jgi:glycosyltransferase involved in cell wall biosynthesis
VADVYARVGTRSEKGAPLSAPVVTCIVPTFRRPAFLARALNSVANQTYRHIRIHVYDNASGDETEQLVRDMAARDSRICYHRHESNIGAQPNFEFGLSRVDTELFSVCADDDALLPRFYAAAVQALDVNTHAMFYCARTVTDDRLIGAFRRGQKAWGDGLQTPSDDTVVRMIGNHFNSTGIVFRSGIQQTIGSFADYASDKSYAIVASAHHPFVADREEHAVFTIHGASFSGGVSGGDRAPHDASFVLRILRETSARLEGTPYAPSSNVLVRDALQSNAQREMLYSALFQSLPHGRWEILDSILDAARDVNMPVATRVGVHALRAVGRVPLLRRAAERFVGASSRFLSRRLGSADARDSDARLAAYLDSNCARPELLA